MNKVQKIIAFVSAVLILLISLVAINEKSYLGGIIGLALAATLLVVCFSGRHKISAKEGFSQRGILKRKSTKIILSCIGIIIISVCVFILYSYLSYQKKQLIEEKEYYGQKEKERIAEQAKIEKDVKYLEHIKIVSSKIERGRNMGYGYSRDLYVEIKNNGNRVVKSLEMEVRLYEKKDYFVYKSAVSIQSDEFINPSQTKKFKLSVHTPTTWDYREGSYKIKIISCSTLHLQ